MPPALLFLGIVVVFQGHLWFHTNFRIFFPFKKNAIGILTWTALNAQRDFGDTDVLTLVMHKKGIALY